MPAFPPFNQGYLAWAALVPLLWFSRHAAPKAAFLGGVVFGFSFHLYINYYLTPVLFRYLSFPLALMTFILMVFALGLFYGAFTYALNKVKDRFPPAVLLFAAPSLWIVMEYARSWGFLGYTTGFLGYSQWNVTFILQTAAFYGYWGLPFLMVSLQMLVVLMAAKAINRTSLLSGAMVWCLLFFWGLLAPGAFSLERPGGNYNIALIQANIPQDEILDNSAADRILHRYLELTREAAGQNEELDLVVWPETVVSLYAGRGNPFLPEIIALTEELQIPLLYGAVVKEDGKIYNAIVMLPPDGSDPGLYFKQRLVPFVEYFPNEKLLNRYLELEVLLGRYSPGSGPSRFNLSGVPISGVICFESYFGDYIRRSVHHNIHHLFILTNDGWFKETIGLDQHAQVGAIRAAELGAGVTQVANTGITVSFDYSGKELVRSAKSVTEIVLLQTDFATRRTFYRLYGEFLLFGAGIFLITCMFIFRKE